MHVYAYMCMGVCVCVCVCELNTLECYRVHICVEIEDIYVDVLVRRRQKELVFSQISPARQNNSENKSPNKGGPTPILIIIWRFEEKFLLFS